MRKIWQSRHHIRYFACAMAVIVGLLPPCAAIAAEETDTSVEKESSKSDTGERETPKENAAEEEWSEKGSEDETDVIYITAFEPLAEEDALLSCMVKPSLEELTDLFPETLSAWMDGEEESAEIEVEWESEDDYEKTKMERYTFYPKWDETMYVIADFAADTIEIPAITVEVPVEMGMIPELEEAKNALQDIIENKSILALVYLCDKYEVKSEPSPDADTVHTVVSGQSVQIIDAELDESGSVWYQTLFYQNGKEYTGYIERGYLAASDEDFVQWEEDYIVLPPSPRMMSARSRSVSYPDVEQFPASYQNALLALKEKHPNWIFVRMDTGIDWSTAISKELGDKSLVPTSSSGSWQTGVYGQGWSYASEGILKYYMDPRNFLTDPAIFQFEQLTYNDSYHTASAVQEILKNSFMSSGIPGDSQTYAQAFTAIGESTGVSPFHLASRVLQEQGTKGTSALISGNYPGYEGYYNYFNVSASGKTDAEVVQSGLKKAKEQGWNTRYKSLNGGAYLIGANYILKGQDTLYLEKFNVSNGYYANFTHQYMQNIQAPNSEAANIRKAYNNAGALENSFVFKIPVFNNMPASACSKPDTTDTITLDRTTVSGLQVNKTVTLIPYVNGSKVDYISNMTFSSDNTSVATVDSTGKITAISPGSAVISCTRSGAGTAVCTVTVVKADPDVSTPTLSPCTYREGLSLADVSLPDGWKWIKEDTGIEAGTHSYEALYTPDDTVKYNTVTKNLSFTVTKAIPNCRMPEKPKVSVGSKLGEIALPDGFVWESDTETELQEPGEYTYYVSYNPDENNYHTVGHLPLVVQVVGDSSNPDDNEGTRPGGSTGSGSGGTSSGGSTGSGSGGTSSGGSTGSGEGNGSGGTSTGTGEGSGSGGTSSGGSTGSGSGGTSSGGSTGSGSGGTSSGGSTGSGSGGTSSGGSTGSGEGNGSGGTSSGGSAGTGEGSGSGGTSSGGSTGSGSGGTSSGGSTGSGSGGTSSGGSTGSGSGGTSSGGSTGSGSSGTDSGGSTGSGSGSTNTSGNMASTAGSSNTGAPLKDLPKPAASAEDEKVDSAENGQPVQESSGNGQPVQESSGNSQPAQAASDSSQPTQVAAGSSQPAKKASRTDSGNTDDETEKEKTEVQQQTKMAEEEQAQEPEESFYRPAVTMSMEDTTILTSEILQMAKEQNLDLLLDMGRYATWSIDIDSLDMDNVREVDMGIALGTENIPTEIIEAILNGNKYLEFTLAHDGPFGFHPLLRVALDPMYQGWYANLFYYNEEAENLEFICDVIIDSDGIATFDMEHASSYVVIVSLASMSNISAPVSVDNESHASRWMIIGVIVCLIAAGAGCGIFFCRKRMQEAEDEDGENEEYEEAEEDYEEAEEEEYEEAEEEYEEVEEEEYEEVGEEEYEEAEEEEYEEAGEEEYEEAEEEEYEHDDEDDWIEDEDWQEPETPKTVASDRFADDHAEDDWIDDDEWDIGNDWIEDAEWEKRKEA